MAEKVTFEKTAVSIFAPLAAIGRGGRRPRRSGRQGPTSTILRVVSSAGSQVSGSETELQLLWHMLVV